MKMKKIISFILFSAILMSLTVPFVSASGETDTYTYVVDGVECTVDFTGSALDDAKRQFVAESLLGIREDDGDTTYGLMCNLFGHKKVTERPTITRHRISDLDPRCAIETWEVISCTRCDYSVQTMISRQYFSCCPEE